VQADHPDHAVHPNVPVVISVRLWIVCIRILELTVGAVCGCMIHGQCIVLYDDIQTF